MSVMTTLAKGPRQSGPRMMRVMGELTAPMTVSTIHDGEMIRVVPGRHPDAIAVVTAMPDESGMDYAARRATARALGVAEDEVEVVGLCGTTDYDLVEGTSASLPDQVVLFVNGWRSALGTEDNPPAAAIARGSGFSEAVVEHVLREMTDRRW